MKPRSRAAAVIFLLIIVLLAASIAANHALLAWQENRPSANEALYLRSSTVLKRMSLGYSGLLADIYWTRAVQYFGNRHRQGLRQFDLLDPMLNIATDLDPHLIPAYETGALLLCQPPPNGADQPEHAVALLQKGIRENPSYWHLYFTLGFVQYLERHDYNAAREAFQKGSEIPGAQLWMKVMAARMAEHADEYDTAIELWNRVSETTHEQSVRDTALEHIRSIHADSAIDALEAKIHAYQQSKGRLPARWTDLIHDGFIPGIPLDPVGDPFRLMADGTIEVQKPDQFPFLSRLKTEKK